MHGLNMDHKYFFEWIRLLFFYQVD